MRDEELIKLRELGAHHSSCAPAGEPVRTVGGIGSDGRVAYLSKMETIRFSIRVSSPLIMTIDEVYSLAGNVRFTMYIHAARDGEIVLIRANSTNRSLNQSSATPITNITKMINISSNTRARPIKARF
jgi:hypothetical protein